MNHDISTGVEFVRLILISPGLAPTEYGIELQRGKGATPSCRFIMTSSRRPAVQRSVTLAPAAWTAIMAAIADAELMAERSAVMPVAIGRPAELFLELQIAGHNHVIRREAPGEARIERGMSGLLGVCGAVIDCADIPLNDRQAMRALLGI